MKRSYRPWSVMTGWLGKYFLQVVGSFLPKDRYFSAFVPYMQQYRRWSITTLSNFSYSGIRFLSNPTDFRGPAQKTIKNDVAISMKDFYYLVICRQKRPLFMGFILFLSNIAHLISADSWFMASTYHIASTHWLQRRSLYWAPMSSRGNAGVS